VSWAPPTAPAFRRARQSFQTLARSMWGTRLIVSAAVTIASYACGSRAAGPPASVSGSAPTATSQEPHGWIETETVKTRVGDFEFKGGYPTADAAQRLAEQQIFDRAAQVYLAQIPVVSRYRVWKGRDLRHANGFDVVGPEHRGGHSDTRVRRGIGVDLGVNRRRWIQGLNNGDPQGAAYVQTVIPLGRPSDADLNRLSPGARRSFESHYVTTEITDSVVIIGAHQVAVPA
jgi:hypothetical protein